MPLQLSGSLSLTGSLSINGSAVGTGGITGVSNTYTAPFFNPLLGATPVLTQLGQGSLQMQPMQLMGPVGFDRMVIPVLYTNSSNSSFSFTVSMYAATYTNNNSSLSLVNSISTAYAITNSGTAGSYSLYGSMRNFTIGTTGTLNAGMYYVGMFSRTTTGGGAGMQLSNLVASHIASTFVGNFGAASATSIGMTQGLGMYSATTNAFPTSIGLAQLLNNQTAYQRAPIFALTNATATSV